MSDILRILGYMEPLLTALVCFFLLLFCRLFPLREALQDKKLLWIMMAYYIIQIVNWLSPMLYFYFPEAYVYETLLYSFSLLLSPVVFYHLLYLITGVGSSKPYSVFHYILPCALAGLFALWSLAQPYEVRLALAVSRGAVQEGYEAFSILYGQRLSIRELYTMFYVALCVRRILNYRKAVVEYSADKSRTSLRWLRVFLFLAVLPILSHVSTLYLSEREVMDSSFLLFMRLVYMLQYSILCYNILVGNYVVISVKERRIAKFGRLDKDTFESYMCIEKPYLDFALKITDLILPLMTNRSYLSAFINKEYGMNFSRYINTLRLNELKRLQADPEYHDFSEKELVLKVGFSTYAGYRSFISSEQRIHKRA
ncbi:AraC family transcriptional regulator [Bacteroides reticulotermitis]|uniref:Transcriptional regulator n=2 Tax=Bacteroides reticulotermitis TaxID=1133319 RepID=W4UUM9_9BACE|nr:AraC family transcriptional regulator [Bacteroides reticulotermitis]MBB4045299.1 AraC-like DNA-binding protein [Bacteroides reticulotermitis]GAE84224.1 transcriptional regulator [Bacteroides reticulotermitis JCM 10512]